MTVFEPVLAAGNVCTCFIACKSKLVAASSCVDCSSATSTHSTAVILKQVSSQVTYNALPYSISRYRCSFHSPTKNVIEACLVEGTAQELCPLVYVVSPCQVFELKGCACTSV